MDKLLFYILFCFVFIGGRAETYTVTFVKGTVTHIRTAKIFRSGEKVVLEDNDVISFSAAEDIVTLVSSLKGRRELRPGLKKDNGEFWALVKDVVQPTLTRKGLGTRTGTVANLFQMEMMLKEIDFAVLDSWDIPLASGMVSNSKNNFFYIRYLFGGEEVNKKLAFRDAVSTGQSFALVLDTGLLRVDNRRISGNAVGEMTMYIYNKKDEASIRIGSVKINFVPEQEVRDLYASLMVYYKADKAAVRRELLLYIESYYGVPDENSIARILKTL